MLNSPASDHEDSQYPDIIFLNGTSSSGKTTLSKALQVQLEPAYLHVALDTFAAMFPECKLEDHELCSSSAPKLFEGFYRSVVALVSCGNKVIVDTVDHEHRVEIFNTLFEGFYVVYVAVKCPLDELERRELARGDRVVGLARRQFTGVYELLPYHIEVDTHVHDAEQCATLIKQAIISASHR